MRPESLFPLFAPITALPGIGPRLAPLIGKLAGEHVVDLLWHLPTGVIDRRYSPKIAEARPGTTATLTVRVDAHQPGGNRKAPYRIVCADDTGFVTLVFFHAKGDYLQRTYPVGATRVVSGFLEDYRGGLQMTHPDHVGTVDEIDQIQRVEPVYPLTAGLALKTLSKAIAAAVDRAPSLPEWIDPAYVARAGLPAWRDAVHTVHRPESAAELEPHTPARRRLAYDELLATQLALLIVRARQRRLRGRPVKGTGKLSDRIVNSLPFSLTPSQTTALAEIRHDMAAESRMLRLLQGDVGSGKTVVAFLAMATAIEAGCQAALMAPTEILARQHHQTIAKLAEGTGLRVALLTGRDKGLARDRLLRAMVHGEVDIVVGTHALFSEDVVFMDLALAVIDEQHRFGVHQRLALSGKGRDVDILVMTATPIPRTLLLAAYGDLDASRLTDKPAGRKPVDTRVLPIDRLADVYGALTRALAEGAQVYWVCPLVEESETTDLAAATDRYEALRQRFGDAVGLVHGRLAGADKDAAMADFAAGKTRILVATTVIEVGVDVPAATVMVIEHAERFGLAQLHQLRGRVRPRRARLVLPAFVPEAADPDRAGAAQHHARDRGRLPHRRGGPAAARRRRSAGHPPERPAGVPPRRPGGPRRVAGNGPRRRPAGARARPGAGLRARRGAAHPALPVRGGRRRPPVALGLDDGAIPPASAMNGPRRTAYGRPAARCRPGSRAARGSRTAPEAS